MDKRYDTAATVAYRRMLAQERWEATRQEAWPRGPG